MSIETAEELERPRAVGRVVAAALRAMRRAVCRELMGHGIGRRLHEQPDVPSVYVPQLTEPLTDGLVMTIEPIVSAGSGRVLTNPDGWTVRTADGARAAHAEHTIVVRDGAPLVLTR
jgi:methionyl aminopeptidase